MALRKILTVDEDEAALRRVCRPVTAFDGRLIQLVEDLYETMRAANDGVGLAAPQVGVLRRVAVVDCGDGETDLINPEILETSGEVEYDEACLSVPGRYGRTKRPERVKVRAYNRLGEQYEVEAEGLKALALVHEIEHLDGVLYLDRLIGELEEVEP